MPSPNPNEIIIKNHKINWICLKDKCPKNCCGPWQLISSQKSPWGIPNTLIPLTPTDLKRLKRKGLTQYLIQKPDNNWYLKTKPNGQCYYLKNGLCTIYPYRPDCCRAYPFYIDKYQGLYGDFRCPGWNRGWTPIKKMKKMLAALIRLYKHHLKTVQKLRQNNL